MFLFLKNKIIYMIISIAFITVAWAKTIQPEKGLNQAKITYQTPESFQGHLLFNRSGIKTNRKASWYAKNDPTDPFPHKYNADGSKFDENAFTCAMRSRDFGKHYKVINLANNKSVIVLHRDYNPFKKYKGRDMSDRVIDLTKAAFMQIADLKEGLIKVKVEEACLRK
jgi:rare lipoprotein A